MVGLYKRRKNNTTDAALDFALPTTNTAGGLQQAQVTAMQDEIHVLKKQLLEVCPFAHLLRTLYIKVNAIICLCRCRYTYTCSCLFAYVSLPLSLVADFTQH